MLPSPLQAAAFVPSSGAIDISQVPLRLQPKLVIGDSDDPLEREADRAADTALKLPDGAPPVRLAGAASSASVIPPRSVREALASAGRPLDAPTRTYFEPRFGRDLSDVRVHTGTKADEAAAAIGARAFTTERSITFGSGEYAPHTIAGRGLLAHELAHVVQQLRAPPTGSRLRLQRKASSSKNTGSRRLACDFVPDGAFFEYLAHEFAYQGNVDGAYLYRTCPQADEAPMETASLPGLGSPASIGDRFAYMAKEPDIPPPIPQKGGANPPLFYKVEMMKGSDPSDAGDGLVAYRLLPRNKADAPSVILFRGTDPKASDIAADADAGGIGRQTFKNHQTQIEKLVLDAKSSSKGKVVLTGHSLGGALAQWTIADPLLTGSINAVYTFNSPGISKADADEFDKTASGMKNKPKVQHYTTRGDVVPTAGDTLLSGSVIEMEGNATRDLQAMFEAGDIARIQEALPVLYGLVAVIANSPQNPLSRWPAIVATWAQLYASGEIDRFEKFGTLLGQLHSQRLLRVSQIRRPQRYSLERLDPDFSQPGDVAMLAQQTGKVALNEKQVDSNVPKSKQQTKIEKARSGLGAAFGDDVRMVFREVLPFIEYAKKHLPTTIAKEMVDTGPLVNLSPLKAIAIKIEPLFMKVMAAVSAAGGLENLVGTALHSAPKEKYVRPLAPAVSTGANQDAKMRAERYLSGQ